MLHVVSLAQFTIAYTQGWAADCPNARIRLKARLERANQEIALLREQLRIKGARMQQIPPHRRPQYPPMERMAILELKAARGWSLKQTAKTFLVTAVTIASWDKRLDEGGKNALVQLRQPVNKFPEFVQHVVQRLKTLCPTMDKVKIAQTLARAGLHLGTTTVGRMLKQKPRPTSKNADATVETNGERIVTAKYPGHVYHVDLTIVPTGLGFWTSWLPYSLPQCWPFCYWVAVVVDHFSRRVMGVTAFKTQPTSKAVCQFLGQTIAKSKQTPKYIVCDRGTQFDCESFRTWCKRKGIKPPRYGAVGHHGSIAVVERFILTLKTILMCSLPVPYCRKTFRHELTDIADWYNEFRPHTWLGGRTPNEVYASKFPANRKPRHEPRPNWPRGSPCAKPWALTRNNPGAKVELEVGFHRNKKHLPIVKLKRVA